MGLLIGVILATIWITYDSGQRHHENFTSLMFSIGETIVVFLCLATLLFFVAKDYTDKHPHNYIAVVKNADGTETSYNVKAYDTKDNTMTLTLQDGTKVFVPITNITISEQTTETTTETK